ncbi:hypothetical protein AB7M16_004941 [Bradyrhizobium sp. USDA 372]
MAFPSFIQSSFILEEAVNPESAKDSVRYRQVCEITLTALAVLKPSSNKTAVPARNVGRAGRRILASVMIPRDASEPIVESGGNERALTGVVIKAVSDVLLAHLGPGWRRLARRTGHDRLIAMREHNRLSEWLKGRWRRYAVRDASITGGSRSLNCSMTRSWSRSSAIWL